MAPQHASALGALLMDDAFDGEVFPNEPMARHTTYRVGGPARYLVRVDSVGALRRVVECAEQCRVPWTVVGRGSNLLVSDAGFKGVVVTLGRDFRNMRFDEQTSVLTAGAAVLLSAAVQEAFRRSLAGLEFEVGTPGTIGGALRMNAGSRTEWISQSLIAVTTYSPRYGLRRRLAAEIEWGYRSTSFDADEVMIECELALSPADPFYIRGKMEASLTRRKQTQPLDKPSCGSVFKSPDGDSAGRLIDAAGLKGAQIGGAQVSEVHANFIVNNGTALAQDVKQLMELVQEKVAQTHGIELQPEVRFLGFE